MILRLWRPGLVHVCGRSGPWQSLSVLALLSSPLRSHPLPGKTNTAPHCINLHTGAAAAPGEDGFGSTAKNSRKALTSELPPITDMVRPRGNAFRLPRLV